MIHTHLIDDILQGIPTEEYKERVAKVRERMKEEGYDTLIFYSNPWRMSNVYWISNYRAFDGISPDPALILMPLEGDLTLFVEKPIIPYAKDETWIEDVRDARPGFKKAIVDYKNTKKPEKIGIIGYQNFALEFYQVVEEVFQDSHVEESDIVEKLKSIKSENEIRLMKVAGRLADQSLIDLQANIKEGMTEREAVQICHTSLFQNGADSQAFDIMVQSGINSGKYCLARARDKKIKKGELLLIDTGVRYRNYVSDMGRGIAFGEISREQQQLLDVTHEAWTAGIPYLKPGISSARASEVIDTVLQERGFDTAHTAAGNRKCGHGLGIDPEEEFPVMGREEHTLQENMSIAYELTVQTPELGGCRLEDVVIIRKDGPEFLTNYARKCQWN
jgi:Xaa-Pro dipeptidase